LRAYDAVQFAAAQQVNMAYIAQGLPSVTFVSADHKLNAAALTEGLAVDDPNLHSRRTKVIDILGNEHDEDAEG